jgi:ribosomal protein S18 acetylase RimI-like enzyme
MHDSGLFARIERYYDAVPRRAARAEEHGPLVLFVSDRAPWPYYARPRVGFEGTIRAEDVVRVRTLQRSLGVPEALEWVQETTPSLLAAAEAAGLSVLLAPLMVLDHSAWRPVPAPPGATVRLLAPDDAELARASAVAGIAFAAAGTADGAAGATQRDRHALRQTEADLDARRRRLREGSTITAIAADQNGPLSVGSHQPVGDVTEIVGVGPLPAARRRGLGAAVTSRLVEDADAGGIDVIFLSAGSEDVARVYARLGFRRIGTACIAQPGP